MRLFLSLLGIFWMGATPAFAQSVGPKVIHMPQSAARKAKDADAIPLPRPRPPEAGPANVAADEPKPEEKPEGEEAATLPPEPPPPSACFLSLTGSGMAVFESMPPIAMPKGCEAPDVVRLDAVILADKKKITFNPPATLRCSLATEIANWVRQDLVPATVSIGALTAIENGSFECRGRNRVVGAKLSEHGKANAMDIGALLFANKKRVNLTDPIVAHDFREKIKADVCGRFSTILGPGSDGYHEEHIHLDLAERRNNYKICQWNVLDVPLPIPRPPEADAPNDDQKNDQPAANDPHEKPEAAGTAEKKP